MVEHESANDTVAAELATLLPRLPRVKITPETITQTTIDRWYGYETEYRQTIAELRAELAAANERANSGIDRWMCYASELESKLGDERNRAEQAEAERDEARAQLAKLSLLRLEWSTANSYSDLGDDIVSEQLARRRVASRPETHAAVVSRQIYAGPWREGACRSCGTTERVAGDPPLCSGCAVYGAGWSSQRPDASLDGLRGPFTGLLGPLGIAPDVRGDGDA